MLSRQTLLLKPMQTAASGYARLQKENACTLVQLHARGLPHGEIRLFACTNGKTAQEIASARTNANGEASMEAEAPKDLQTLLLMAMPAKPLLIGLCGAQDAGSLLSAKNMALALCERLNAVSKPTPTAAPPPPAVQPADIPPKNPRPSRVPSLPREIFLPAIDPAPYTTAACPEPEPILPPPRPAGPSVDHLPPLRWPRGFAALRSYFETRMPVRLFALPGWRFVEAAQGMFIGVMALDGRVQRAAYACSGKPPKSHQLQYRPAEGLDGKRYQVLWMDLPQK